LLTKGFYGAFASKFKINKSKKKKVSTLSRINDWTHFKHALYLILLAKAIYGGFTNKKKKNYKKN